jgi:hypothetical protein
MDLIFQDVEFSEVSGHDKCAFILPVNGWNAEA